MWKAALPFLLLCAGCQSGEGDDDAPVPAAPGAAQLSAFEAQAVRACRCARKPGADSKSCWKDFDRAVSPFRPSRGGTMCGRLSIEETCFGPSFDQCITLDYGAGACTPDEADRLIPIYESAPFERRDAVLDEAIRRLDRGEALAATGSAEARGC